MKTQGDLSCPQQCATKDIIVCFPMLMSFDPSLAKEEVQIHFRIISEVATGVYVLKEGEHSFAKVIAIHCKELVAAIAHSETIWNIIKDDQQRESLIIHCEELFTAMRQFDPTVGSISQMLIKNKIAFLEKVAKDYNVKLAEQKMKHPEEFK